ncbi:hypothetical protein C8R48DRAFT_678011 [Suillus tomentosus]|nr:hypothetical protein C8R48DRAFT_678011 [Suillus tomentosus]
MYRQVSLPITSLGHLALFDVLPSSRDAALVLENIFISQIRREAHNYEATSEGQYFPIDEYVLVRAGDMPSIRREVHNCEATSEGQYFPVDEYVLARAGDMPSIRREVHNCEATSEGQYFPVDDYVLARAGDKRKCGIKKRQRCYPNSNLKERWGRI